MSLSAAWTVAGRRAKPKSNSTFRIFSSTRSTRRPLKEHFEQRQNAAAVVEPHHPEVEFQEGIG
eukprot:1742355-Amphidinium_carterae.2